METQTTEERTQLYHAEIDALYKDLTAKGKVLTLSAEFGVGLALFYFLFLGGVCVCVAEDGTWCVFVSVCAHVHVCARVCIAEDGTKNSSVLGRCFTAEPHPSPAISLANAPPPHPPTYSFPCFTEAVCLMPEINCNCLSLLSSTPWSKNISRV